MGIARIFLVFVITGILGWIGLLGGAIESMPYRNATAIFVPPAEAGPAGEAAGMAEARAGAKAGAAEGETARPTHIVSATALRLREKPTTASAVIGSYLRGTAVVVSQKDGSWAEVSLPDGKAGWMAARWLAAKEG